MSSEIEDIFDEVYDGFDYVPDQEQYQVSEDWRAHYTKEFGDDCDGFAITCAVRLHEAGYDPRLIYCKTETGGGHLVCGVDTDTETLILDNRYHYVRSAGDLSYTWVSSMRSSEPGVWREIL